VPLHFLFSIFEVLVSPVGRTLRSLTSKNAVNYAWGANFLYICSHESYREDACKPADDGALGDFGGISAQKSTAKLHQF